MQRHNIHVPLAADYLPVILSDRQEGMKPTVSHEPQPPDGTKSRGASLYRQAVSVHRPMMPAPWLAGETVLDVECKPTKWS